MGPFDPSILGKVPLQGLPNFRESYRFGVTLRDLADQRRVRELELRQRQMQLDQTQQDIDNYNRMAAGFASGELNENSTLADLVKRGGYKLGLQFEKNRQEAATARLHQMKAVSDLATAQRTAEAAEIKKQQDARERATGEIFSAISAPVPVEQPHYEGQDPAELAAAARQARAMGNLGQGPGQTPEGKPVPTYGEALQGWLSAIGPTRAQAYLDKVQKDARDAAKFPLETRKLTAETKHAEDVALGTVPETAHEKAMREGSEDVNDWIRIKNNPNSTPEARKIAEANIAEYERVHPRAAAALAPGATETDAADIADAIIRGDRNPITKGLYKTGVAVEAILARKGYNKARAELDWNAIQRHLSTLNSASQERLRQAIDFTYHSLDTIDDLYKQWTEKGLNTRFGSLNKLSLAAAKGLGGEAGAIAQGLETQINDLTSEMATVYKGGNASTDEGLRLASENLRGNWNEQTFKKSMELLRNNLRIRRNSILSSEAVGVSPGSPYLPPAPAGETSRGAGQGTVQPTKKKRRVWNEQKRAFEEL